MNGNQTINSWHNFLLCVPLPLLSSLFAVVSKRWADFFFAIPSSGLSLLCLSLFAGVSASSADLFFGSGVSLRVGVGRSR